MIQQGEGGCFVDLTSKGDAAEADLGFRRHGVNQPERDALELERELFAFQREDVVARAARGFDAG